MGVAGCSNCLLVEQVQYFLFKRTVKDSSGERVTLLKGQLHIDMQKGLKYMVYAFANKDKGNIKKNKLFLVPGPYCFSIFSSTTLSRY